jgi:hypothetical protein
VAAIRMKGGEKAIKNFAQSLDMTVAAPKPIKPKPKDNAADPADPLKPIPFLDQVSLKMKDILSEASEARQYSITLKAYELSKDLVEQLNKHCTEMEQIYRDLQALQISGVKKEEKYRPLLATAEEKSAWYQPRGLVAKKMQTSVIKPPKAPKKTKKDKS